MNTKIDQEALTDEALNEVVGGFNFGNFFFGSAVRPSVSRFILTEAQLLAAPVAVGSVISTVGSVVSHLKFW
jgi:hypothetical protein